MTDPDQLDDAPATEQTAEVLPALPMDAADMIRKFKEFFEQYYYGELLEALRKGERHMGIDFQKLVRFDPQLGDLVLDQPQDALKAGELAVREFDAKVKQFTIRLSNLPGSSFLMLRHVRSRHLGKIMFTEGIVRQKSDVRPQVTEATFECPSCGNRLSVLQLDTTFKEPTRCSCGRKGKFKLTGKELVDAQGIVLEEAAEQLEGGEQPKRMNIFLKNDLVSPITEKRTNPGSKIRITGVIKEVPITTKSGGTSTRFDLLIEANHVLPVEEDFSEITISKEEMQKILDLKNDPHIEKKLIDSVAPNIYGHEKIKEALVLQLMGGVRKTRDQGAGATTRGDIHILLIGDPGSGKSQMLKRISKVALRGRFISGKGVSGAGLTASVVKDEFLSGWSLEAGALVLSNKGICCIDELDKMTDEDRAAMHEALEGQSYHPDTELLLADGSRTTIGSFVDDVMRQCTVVQGTDCEFAFPKDTTILTTDFQRVAPARIARVSRHPAPTTFFRITFSNGRAITVTPEHPLFVYTHGEVSVTPACMATVGTMVPAPRRLPIEGRAVALTQPAKQYHHAKPHVLPTHLNADLARLLGYVVTEGHCYANPTNRTYEIGVSNTDTRIINEVAALFRNIFATDVIVTTQAADKREKATRDLYTVRCCSRPIHDFFALNFPELMTKAPRKRAPSGIMRATEDCVRAFLQGAFRGDGTVSSDDVGFATASRKLAEDYQDLMLRLGTPSIIRTEHRNAATYHKTIVTGTVAEKTHWADSIVVEDDPRHHRIRALLRRAAQKNNQRDPVPSEIAALTHKALLALKMADGNISSTLARGHAPSRQTITTYVDKIDGRLDLIARSEGRTARRLANVQVSSLAEGMGRSSGHVYNAELDHHQEHATYTTVLDRQVARKIGTVQELMAPVKRFLDADLRVHTITNVERIDNPGIALVYDVTVEPHHSFISQGMVLHNTVTISKANIQATLRCETTVLAAANPKLGRFDPYEIIAKQIDLPPTLINRFDLIFPIKDLPDPVKDNNMASFILEMHRTEAGMNATIDTPLFRKFVAYAKLHIRPHLSEEAIAELKDYYIRMRGSSSRESGVVKSIPISARQLEGLVRLSEAHARMRLSEIVERKDARKAIELLDYCLRQIALDEETGQIDIDRIGSDTSSSQRNKILQVKEIIKTLENKVGKVIPIDDVEQEAAQKGVTDAELDEIIQKLKKSGDVFEPKSGYISRI